MRHSTCRTCWCRVPAEGSAGASDDPTGGEYPDASGAAPAGASGELLSETTGAVATPEPGADGSSPARTRQEALERLATAAAHAATDWVEAAIPDHVAALQRAGIRVIVLKGPVTRNRLYGTDERRPVADVGLLVDPSGFRRAARVFEAGGFTRVDRHGHSDTFVSDAPRVPDVDLHLTLPYVTIAPRRAFAVFSAHTTTMRVAGVPVPVLDVPAHVVHLAIHAAVNRFTTTGRTFDEWRRGHASLADVDAVVARQIAGRLGIADIWDSAVWALAADTPAERAARAAELPTWEVEARAASARRFLASGTPLWVKWRDLERLVTLQLSDDTLNVWRAKSGRAPLEPGSWKIRAAKPLRLVAVSARGAGRACRSLLTRRGIGGNVSGSDAADRAERPVGDE